MASIETVRIKDKDVPGGKLINASDFNEKEHTLHGSESAGRASGSKQASRSIARAGKRNPATKAAKADAKSKRAAKSGEVKAITGKGASE